MGTKAMCMQCLEIKELRHSCGPPPTITIPVAEYERLQRRAKVYEALTPNGWGSILSGLAELHSEADLLKDMAKWRDLSKALTAAIKEQEG